MTRFPVWLLPHQGHGPDRRVACALGVDVLAELLVEGVDPGSNIPGHVSFQRFVRLYREPFSKEAEGYEDLDLLHRRRLLGRRPLRVLRARKCRATSLPQE